MQVCPTRSFRRAPLSRETGAGRCCASSTSKASRRSTFSTTRATTKTAYAAADTMKIIGSIFIRNGTVLYSVNCNPMFTVIDDTCGYHDTIGGCCSRSIASAMGSPRTRTVAKTSGAARALRHGSARHGRKPQLLGRTCFVGADGAMDMGPSISKPGDYVDLRAEMDVLAVISNCPQMNNPVNDYNPTPVRAMVWQPGA